MKSEHPIVFYDGICGFCHKTVELLRKYDSRNRLRFAPLQGRTAEHMLAAKDHTPPYETLVLILEGVTYYRSEAALRALALCNRPLSMLLIFLVVPSFIRDAVYQLISQNRYRLFGKTDSCPVPDPAERAYFLD
jgi:predicted DCC family thiol-disulfide oxidoreductase YuxK